MFVMIFLNLEKNETLLIQQRLQSPRYSVTAHLSLIEVPAR